jgi:cytochrome bd-type quinol oxidase subunit 2
MNKYLGPIRALGGAAVISFIIGLVFPALAQGITDERTRNGVLVQSVPFVAFFVAILLLFILLIVLVARRFNNQIPHRAYQPIETLIILGIVGGVVCLFQPFAFSPYKYGFVMLLGATLSFILWSHVVPRSAKADRRLPSISMIAHVIAAAAAVAVLVFLVSSAVTANRPVAPFGVRERVWNSYDDARRAEITATAEADFNNVEVPVLILLNLLPALMIYFAGREVVDGLLQGKARQAAAQSNLRASTA